MAKNLDIYENQIQLGQVKTITTGSILNYVELLFSPTTKSQFYYKDVDNSVQIVFSDTDLQIPNFTCTVDKETLRNLIVGLKTLYGQLKEGED